MWTSIVEPERGSQLTEWIHCDLTDDDSGRDAIETVKRQHGNTIASVIHLAAYYDFAGEPSSMYEELTVEGTRRLMRALKPLDVERFVFSSSLLVMKPVEDLDDRLDEQSPTRAEWDYPESKLAAERVLQQERGDMPVTVLRIAGVYDEDGHSLPIVEHIKRIYEKQIESVVFPGEAHRGQPFVHLDDLTDCFARVVELRGELEPWEVFLIAEPDTMTYDQLQDCIGELVHGREWPTIRIPKAVAKAGAWAKDNLLPGEPFIKPWMIDLADNHYPVEASRARERLDWAPKHRLRETLTEIVQRLKHDPEEWYQRNGLIESVESDA